jgi:hypothetical protein
MTPEQQEIIDRKLYTRRDRREASLAASSGSVQLESAFGVIEQGAKWLDEMSSDDGSGHKDLAVRLRQMAREIREQNAKLTDQHKPK